KNSVLSSRSEAVTFSTMFRSEHPRRSSSHHEWRHNKENSNALADDVPEFQAYDGTPRSQMPDDLQEEQNRREHHTDLFASPNLIVRRGQEFRISITFDGPYNPSKDGFYVEFRIGVNPQIHKQTAIIVSPNQDNKGPWQSQLLENKGNIIEMGITPSANCIVGKFLMYAVVVAPTGLIRDKENSSEIYILFNSWAPDDTVFMHDDTERMEYVLNQVGTIYCGSISNVMKRPWHYGQFENGILDACLYLMDDATIPLISRGDPVVVARQGSAKLNSQDDNGVLTGKWSEDYSHGRAPTSWTGSVEILHLYASNGVPVNYAQCWVYAGVFNTFLRCLGIPSRVITNYNSAHDNDRSLKTDIIVDCNGKIDKKYTKDSIWNFHCWNECYMARPDLPLDFGGWQVVDATPQETSDGLYRCGPAPLYGIKQGVICYPYDSPFVFAEVNSDVIFYKRDKYGKLTKVSVNETYVGKMLLTKAIGQDVPINITELYKFPEGTMQERLALQMAESYGTEKDRSVLPKVDVEMKVTVKPVTLGEDFQLVLIFQSLGRSLYNVDVFVSGNVMYYTGVSGPEFMSTTLQVQVDPSRQKTKVPSKYMNKLFGHGNLHFFITGKVKETGHMLNIMHPVSLISPQLTVKVTGVPQVNQRMFVTVEFTNNFGFSLKDVTLTVEGTWVLPPKTKTYSSIAPASTITWTQSFIPMDPGLKMLMACLDCEYLRQVCGTASVYINV
uniref:protein-glutamine gamma-glutamyltransferase n=1 Tax=Scleropages formosus TaxID=113540 RepID=A0A8C9QY61_SCLFO